MRFRDAKKLRLGDEILSSKDKASHKVSSIEVFLEAKQVRIYTQEGLIFYNKEVE